MADITYPVWFPFAGTDVTDGDRVYSLFFDPAAPTASLSVINGFLGEANFGASFELEDLHTQPGSSVNAWAASGNSNLDWMERLFGGVTFSTGSGEDIQITTLATNARYYIPGGNRTFYLPVDSYIVVMWKVYWNAQIDSAALSRVYFHVDGTVDQTTGRNIAKTAPITATEISRFATNEGYKKARVYSGHYASPHGVPLTAGWHTVGLGIFAEPGTIVTRTYSCDIVVMSFKA